MTTVYSCIVSNIAVVVVQYRLLYDDALLRCNCMQYKTRKLVPNCTNYLNETNHGFPNGVVANIVVFHTTALGSIPS